MAHRLPLADIQFIADFAAFARGKGEQDYPFMDNCGCALGQFLYATGRAASPYVIGFGQWADGGEPPEDSRFNQTPEGVGNALVSVPWTFSALADRLEALIADAPVVARA